MGIIKDMSFEIFLATAPGLETALYNEVRSKGFKRARPVNGGVTAQGDWPDVWRANLWIRGASRVLARVGSFRALNLSQLEHNVCQIDWRGLIHPDIPFRVQATCAKSRIYHSGAAAERIENGIAQTLGTPAAEAADITIMARIFRDVCTLSIDTSGDLLHKQGFKERVNKAPMRENMAALFLQECGYTGAEPFYDPMCGSGTFVIEAAEIAARLNPGRERHFAFQDLATYDAQAWEKMKNVARQPHANIHSYGTDRDDGAIEMCGENAARAGVNEFTHFKQENISDIAPPTTEPGLILTNPPYGARIGDQKTLLPLYQSLGQVLKTRFQGWRLGMVATDASLVKSTGLTFISEIDPIQHGGLRIRLFQTGPV